MGRTVTPQKDKAPLEFGPEDQGRDLGAGQKDSSQSKLQHGGFPERATKDPYRA